MKVLIRLAELLFNFSRFQVVKCSIVWDGGLAEFIKEIWRGFAEKIFHLLQDWLIPLCIMRNCRLVLFETVLDPYVLLDFAYLDSLLWVFLDHCFQQDVNVAGNSFDLLEFWVFDQLVQLKSVFMLKRQFTHQHSVQGYSHGPNIDFSAVILLTCNHFRRCVTWWPTWSFHHGFGGGPFSA